uniref:Uncharacterized protein n=1 Tax=Arundo donax TaxID=35708 RepID=A0A0A9CPQ3_ARUDO
MAKTCLSCKSSCSTLEAAGAHSTPVQNCLHSHRKLQVTRQTPTPADHLPLHNPLAKPARK